MWVSDNHGRYLCLTTQWPCSVIHCPSLCSLRVHGKWCILLLSEWVWVWWGIPSRWHQLQKMWVISTEFISVLMTSTLLFIDTDSVDAGGIGEYGCLRAFHCEGGAVCDDRRCICPNGYHATASHTKCAKRGGRHSEKNRDLVFSKSGVRTQKSQIKIKRLAEIESWCFKPLN